MVSPAVLLVVTPVRTSGYLFGHTNLFWASYQDAMLSLPRIQRRLQLPNCHAIDWFTLALPDCYSTAKLAVSHCKFYFLMILGIRNFPLVFYSLFSVPRRPNKPTPH